MNYRNIASNALFAFAAQGLSVLLNAIISFVLPKVLGVEEFGFWQLFLFYAGYTGFLHLGLNDGVYLCQGGVERSRIDKKDINSEYRFSLGYQLIFAVAIAVLTIFWVKDGNRAFVLLMESVYLLLNNSVLYFSYVFQAMNETKCSSVAVVIDKVVFVIPLVVMMLAGISNFVPYVLAYAISKGVALAFCIWNARDFFSAGLYGLGETACRVWSNIKIGLNLTVASLASSLILGVARFLIDARWGIEAFGKASLALSLVNFFLLFVSQASMVLFPALRQGTASEKKRTYSFLLGFMEIAFPAVYLLYYPAAAILGAWLPQYADSILYFAILLPICLFEGKMDICCTTFFKVLRKERSLLKINIVTVLLSAVLSVVGVYFVGEINAVLIFIVIMLALRSLYSEFRLNNEMEVSSSSLPYQEILLSALFVIAALTTSLLLGFLITAFAYVAYLCINRNWVMTLLSSGKRLLVANRP